MKRRVELKYIATVTVIVDDAVLKEHDKKNGPRDGDWEENVEEVAIGFAIDEATPGAFVGNGGADKLVGVYALDNAEVSIEISDEECGGVTIDEPLVEVVEDA